MGSCRRHRDFGKQNQFHGKMLGRVYGMDRAEFADVINDPRWKAICRIRHQDWSPVGSVGTMRMRLAQPNIPRITFRKSQRGWRFVTLVDCFLNDISGEPGEGSST